MAYINDGCIAPKEFIIPTINIDGSETPRTSGALVMSGAKLGYISAGLYVELS